MNLSSIFHWRNILSVTTLAGVAASIPAWQNFFVIHDYKDLIQAVGVFVWGLLTNASTNATITK